ncbi:MAG TPA: OB-fold domain-containing protein [Acidimicrobiales bacterium]|nr:OB-fold domain-containing protein [Acidimicrobiales bacterium]
MSGVQRVSVLAAGVAAPALRLPAAEVAAAWGGGARGSLGICDSDEDTLTLAWQAATEAIGAAGVSPDQISGLWWGTTRPPFAEGPSLSFLAAALGLRADVEGALLAGSPHSGMEALFAAWDALASSHATLALVVTSDALLPGLGTAGETTTGAGAAALLLGRDTGLARASLVARATRSAPVVDRYRADGDSATGDVYDGRLFREEVYLPLMTEVARAVGAPGAWAVSDPDGKLSGALAKRLGAPLVSSRVQSVLGDTGAAASLLDLIHATSGDGDAPGLLGFIGYGGGRASAVSVEVTGPVPGAQGVQSILSAGQQVTYTKALRARGQLEAMADPIPMGLPPAGAAFARGNLEMLLFEGARCADCGAISTPPSVHPACIACGGTKLETVKLSRKGTVVTFVVNQTMPPPFAAPLPLVVIDLADGARIMVQGTPADAELLAVGDSVWLSLRRYALERGIPVYGYKARRFVQVPAPQGPGETVAPVSAGGPT